MRCQSRRIVVLLLCVAAPFLSGCKDSGSAGVSNPRKLFKDPKVISLAEALRKNDLVGAEAALKSGADINAIGDGGITLLTWAVLEKNKSGFTWLLEHGADPNLVPSEDRGVLFWVSGAEDTYWLEQLIKHKANVNLTRPGLVGDIKTPLKEAILQGRIGAVEILIKAGADVNLERPVIDAGLLGWFEGVHMLLESGADPNAQTLAGDSLAYLVTGRSSGITSKNAVWREKVLNFLRQRGVDVESAEKKVRERDLERARENR